MNSRFRWSIIVIGVALATTLVACGSCKGSRPPEAAATVSGGAGANPSAFVGAQAAVDLYFDYANLYQENPADKSRITFPNKRYVWWMRSGNLQYYAFETKDHKIIPPTANQAGALNNIATKGASILIPSLLFRKANLPSALLALEQSSDAGMEDLDGHPCHKVIGVAAEVYPSGQRVNVRQVTISIDRDSLLIRKVFHDTPKNYGADTFYRVTIALQPQANPDLDDAKFDFQVPDVQQQ